MKLSKWDLLHGFGTLLLVLIGVSSGVLHRSLWGFVIALQMVWIAWLAVERGQLRDLAREYLHALRGLSSVILSLYFIHILKPESSFIAFLSVFLGLCGMSIAIIFSDRMAKVQAAKSTNEPKPSSASGGIFYFNKLDSRILVPRGEYGVGIGFNYARPEVWFFLFVMIVGPILLKIYFF